MACKNVFNYLKKNLNLSSDSFTDRIISQKTIYILQEMGLDMGYGFKWYLYGVYSQELANDFFNYSDNDETFISDFQEKIIKKFLELKKENIQNPIFLETVSSILYLKKQNQFDSKEEIFNKLIKIKSHLNDKESFEKAYEKIETLIS